MSISSPSTQLNKIGQWSVIGAAFAVPISTALMNVFFAMAGVCCVLSVDLRAQLGRTWHIRPVLFAMGLFLALSLSLLYTTASTHYALTTLVAYSKLLYLPLLLPFFRDKQCRDRAIIAFIAAMVLTLIVFYAKAFAITFFHWPLQTEQIFKYYITTNLFMAFSAYLLAVLAIQRPTYRVWCYFFLPLMVINILFMSDGRSGYIVFLALCALLCWRQWGARGIFIGMLSCAVLLILAYFSSAHFQARIDQAQDEYQAYVEKQDVTTSEGKRLLFYKTAWQFFKADPILGTGVGSFPERYQALKLPSVTITENPHNEYFSIAVQLGSVGLLLLLGLFFTSWRDSLRLNAVPQLVAIGTVLAIAVGSLANSWLLDAAEGHFFVLFIALAFANQGE